MRQLYVIGAMAILIGLGTSYGLVGRPALSPKMEASPTIAQAPRVETARLFAAPHDVSPAPARDLIATKLATPPVIWPEVPKPAVDPKSTKPPSIKKPKVARQAQKPKAKKKQSRTVPGAT